MHSCPSPTCPLQAKAKGGAASRLLFKKHLCMQQPWPGHHMLPHAAMLSRACLAHHQLTHPSLQFVNLSYIQAQHDYLAGQYPVIREDAAQMAALQMQAEHGPTLAGDAAGFEAALEKYMVKQASQG